MLYVRLRSCLAEHVTGDECLGATSFLQKSVEPIVPIALDATAGSQCMAEDLEKAPERGESENRGDVAVTLVALVV